MTHIFLQHSASWGTPSNRKSKRYDVKEDEGTDMMSVHCSDVTGRKRRNSLRKKTQPSVCSFHPILRFSTAQTKASRRISYVSLDWGGEILDSARRRRERFNERFSQIDTTLYILSRNILSCFVKQCNGEGTLLSDDLFVEQHCKWQNLAFCHNGMATTSR
jgi:hypothetical protein